MVVHIQPTRQSRQYLTPDCTKAIDVALETNDAGLTLNICRELSSKKSPDSEDLASEACSVYEGLVGRIRYNETKKGEIDITELRSEDGYVFVGDIGDEVRIELQPDFDDENNLFDPHITLYVPEWSYFQVSDDAEDGTLNAVITHTIEEQGKHLVVVGGYSSYGSYELTLTKE